MKAHTKLTAALAATGLALAASSATAATTILSEDWQTPNVANKTQLDDTNTFAGWKFIQGNGNVFKLKDTPDNGIPGGAEGSANQVLQFEWAGSAAEYDTGHNWSATDSFNVSFNATELNWSNQSDRTVVLSLTETSRDGGGNLIGTTVWTKEYALPEYDSNHDGAAEDWSLAQTFTDTIDASLWGAGTPGSALTLEVGSTDSRGLYIDNIVLDLVPEPSTTALLGLGSLALMLRRRR